jgi:hypothetical protein
MRQLLDLTRFLLPWSIMPRRLGSRLFRTPSGEPEGGVCSTMIAEAFHSVHFPILPALKADEGAGVELVQRNPHLFTPKDFDYSPYFEIIKYPFFNPEQATPYYRRLPWSKEDILHHDDGVITHNKLPRKSFLKKLISGKPQQKNVAPQSTEPSQLKTDEEQ